MLPENIDDLEIAIRYLGNRRRCYEQRSRKLVKTHESLRQDGRERVYMRDICITW